MVNGPILILGGTLEASHIARNISDLLGADAVITSLAGATLNPKPVSGRLRSGGFGGIESLALYLKEAKIVAVIDATHPFAKKISNNAEKACSIAQIPRVNFHRKPWEKDLRDSWVSVSNVKSAVEVSRFLGKRNFLTLGPRAVSEFSVISNSWFLIRVIDPLKVPFPLLRHKVILGRGPFTLANEKLLMKRYNIDLVITRNSGGEGAYAKILAARQLKLPVVMIERPPPPEGHNLHSVECVVKWLLDQLGRKI